MKLMKRYPGCFVCGDKNPIGLNVPFYVQGEEVVAEYTATRHFEGYKNILHGGILSALLDEVMIRAVLALEICCVTSEIRVRFRKMVNTGNKLSLVGRLVEDKGRILTAEGKITNQHNQVVAEGEATFVRVRGEMEKQLSQEIE